MCDFDAIQCLMFIRVLVDLNNLSIKDRDWTHNPPTEDGNLPPMWRVELGWFICFGFKTVCRFSSKIRVPLPLEETMDWVIFHCTKNTNSNRHSIHQPCPSSGHTTRLDVGMSKPVSDHSVKPEATLWVTPPGGLSQWSAVQIPCFIHNRSVSRQLDDVSPIISYKFQVSNFSTTFLGSVFMWRAPRPATLRHGLPVWSGPEKRPETAPFQGKGSPSRDRAWDFEKAGDHTPNGGRTVHLHMFILLQSYFLGFSRLYIEYPINLLQLYSLNSWDFPFQIYIKGVVYRNMTNLPVLVVEFAGFISGSTMAPNKGKFKGYLLVNVPV